VPTRGAAELMRASVGDFPVNRTSMISFAVWTVALGALAVIAYRRDEGVR
jgi:ABC-2 type transport system permease protein